MQELISARELAVMLDTSERTIWRMLSKGKLIKPIRFGGSTRWRHREVLTWLDAGCPVPSEGPT